MSLTALIMRKLREDLGDSKSTLRVGQYFKQLQIKPFINGLQLALLLCVSATANFYFKICHMNKAEENCFKLN